MRGIYSKRAKLLYNLLNTAQCDLNMTDLINQLFQSDPSFTEQAICSTCAQPNTQSAAFPLVVLSNEIFSNDFSNFEKAITENLPGKLTCRRCNKEVECKREFSPHMFIEVINIM